MPPLTKEYLEFCFSYYFKQIITSSNRTTDRTVTLIDDALINSGHKVSQLDVIDLGLSDHDLIFCTQEKQDQNLINITKYLSGQWNVTKWKTLEKH